MKIATWNVNSLRVRLPHLLDWLAAAQPDVACLQETKTEDANFPLAEIQAAGYQAVYCGQKSYNGVAILARSPLTDVQHGIPDFPDDPKRVIAATVEWRAHPQSVRAERPGAGLGQVRLQAAVVLRRSRDGFKS